MTATDLRREVLEVVGEWARELRAEPEVLNNRWRQPHVVLAYRRTLHTLDGGRVASKRAAGRWALGALDPEWAGLIQRDRPDPWLRVHQPSDRQAVRRTWSFVDYALQVAARYRLAGSLEG